MSPDLFARARSFADAKNGKGRTPPATLSASDLEAWRASSRSSGRGGVFARNPAVAQLMAHDAYFARLAQREAPPTLFSGGDVPPFVASGAAPELLLRLPAQLRHHAAKADAGEFARLMSEWADCSDEDAQLAAIAEPVACADRGWGEYQARVQAWSQDWRRNKR